MTEPFTGEIRRFAGTFAPRGWALCDGQLVGVSQNDALFSLYGTIYGGDGRSTFGLPDMRGRIPVHWGTGPGLTPRRIGQKSGTETVTININEMPAHTHQLNANTQNGDSNAPAGRVPALSNGEDIYSPPSNQLMNINVISKTGGSQKHTNLQPTLCVNFIAALFGIYPSRS